MYPILKTLRVVEASSFVAAPTAGLYLSQLGAEVIRIDQIGGGPDFRRWPLAPNGASFYWEGLNKGKKSVAIDTRSAEGRELMVALATAPGPDSGIFLTNFPAHGFLSHEALKAQRADIVTVRIMGQADGGPALDYTVNCALGIPQITGPKSLGNEPVNHVLPAWDLLTGAYAAFMLLAAREHRERTGAGEEVRIPLTDVGIATISNMGQLAEVVATGTNRIRYGNDIYGAFGRDFVTSDGVRLMLLAITPGQWKGLVATLGIGEEVARIEHDRSVSFDEDEGVRFQHRQALFELIETSLAGRKADELCADLTDNHCCWGRYQDMQTAIADPNLVSDNPLFSNIHQVSGLTYPAPGSMATLTSHSRQAAVRAPLLGEHTDAVLAELLGLGDGQIGRLHDLKVVAGPG